VLSWGDEDFEEDLDKDLDENLDEDIDLITLGLKNDTF